MANAQKSLVAMALAVATALVYVPVFENELVDYDDDYYISDNPNLELGLSPEGLAWAFTTSRGANWHPITWLSLMLDYELFGISPQWFHAVNVALHAASVVLLFTVFSRMTGSVWPSAFVAAVFGLHPLHVESVAWASERKDVLSGLFWMLTLLAYSRYAERPGARKMSLVALFLALGLLSKPMLVTLPFVLLLLDIWPLRRLTKASWSRLLLEKVPLFALVFVSSVVTFLVQRSAGAVQSFQTYSFSARLSNALVTYVAYIGRAFWPLHLSPYYPHPGDTLEWWKVAASVAALAGASLTALVLARRDPRLVFVSVGWLWYVGTLVPVIGLVQVGQQAMADRYTYIPFVGLSIVVAFGVAELVNLWGLPRLVPIAVGGAGVLAMSVAASAQVRVWRDSVSLFEHALAIDGDNALAHINLGVAYLNRGNLEKAETELREAIRLHAGAAEAYSALAAVRSRRGRTQEALDLYRTALRLDPSSSGTHSELGRLLLELGDASQALVHFREAAALSPGDGDALVDLGMAMSHHGRFDEAMAHFRDAATRPSDPARLHTHWGVALMSAGQLAEAIRHFEMALASRPDYAPAHFSWGQAALREGNVADAISHLKQAVRLEPEDEEAHYHLGLAFANANELDEAFAHLERARTLNPDRAATYYSLGLLFASRGDLDRAADSFRKSLSLDSNNPEAHYSLGLTYAGRGRLDEAISCYRSAVELDPEYVAAHNGWGVALASLGRLDDAVARFEVALAIAPGLAETHNNLGMALSQRGAVVEATEHFHRAVSLEPTNADAYTNLGVSLVRQGRLDEALKSFEKAVELAPDDVRARSNLEGARQALREGKRIRGQ
ncbi:MAG TPA: tetratricopeptide repeat protein [Vicinamibacteria bacterium]|nr:tetratricopeptide repeat protein [Vicinamibacteria bacterium]